MREIKIRAYDKDGLYTDGKPGFVDIIGDHAFDAIFHDDDFVKELYTGLKDKNGVEIYEGDIFKHKVQYIVDNFKECSYVQTDENGDRVFKKIELLPCVVKQYKTGGYCLYNQQYDFTTPFWVMYRDLETMEIIGNTHENPELLEKS